MTANLDLRLATLDDAAEIAAMSRDLIEMGLGWTWTAARVARNIRSASTLTVVAGAPGRLAGFAIMYFGDEHAHLSLLAVRPQWQRAGLGRRLVGWLEESALTAGIGTVRLELRASNRAARRFYARLGFAEVARVPAYYGGVETAVRMSRDIRRGTAGPVPDLGRLLRR
ncbi:MAG TPA: GNAT family N-acetyltransferase [Burkholderiales bacterium]|nr:GNAT family N-acetyltransferase [Burkholderiales bacterium]